MALKNCKECGNEVSTKADKCPNCGAPVKDKGIGCITSFILIGAFIFIINSFTSNSNTKSTTKPKTITGPNVLAKKGHDMIKQMSEGERKVLMQDILEGSGKSCKGVNKLFFRGFDADKAAYWTVGCFENLDYQVQIPDDPKAKTRILECEILKSLDIDCWTKF